MPPSLTTLPEVFPLAPDSETSLQPENGGWCARCATVHSLPSAPAHEACRELMALLREHGRIDWQIPKGLADPRCATAPLFGEAGGKMFGVLRCRNLEGAPVVLRAFSGQFNGLWRVPGWVGPIFDVDAFERLVWAPEREIKRIGREMDLLPRHSARRRHLRNERRERSRQLMREVHELYRLANFRGETAPLAAAFCGEGGPPSGTGDCCGPKLLHHAAQQGLRPDAMAEFYWGRGNASATKVHGQLYPACSAKCQMIMGFQLCGLQ